MELRGHVADRAFELAWPTATLEEDDRVYLLIDYWASDSDDDWETESEFLVEIGTSSKRFFPAYKRHRAIHKPWLKAEYRGQAAVKFLKKLLGEL